MDEAIEEDGFTLKYIRDEDAESPRTFDNLGVMLCFHSKYRLGDGNGGLRTGDYSDWEDMGASLRVDKSAIVVLPLYLYDHSGLTMSTGSFADRWDSGQVGLIYMTHESAYEAWGDCLPEELIAKAEACLRAEVETYDQYLRGDVWGYTIDDADGNHEDSCFGFYGEDAVKEAGREALDACKRIPGSKG